MAEMIQWAKPVFWGKEKEYVNDALSSTWISGGPYVAKLESEFAKAIGSKNAIVVNNGTSALMLALLGINIKQGDEVIIPGFCFVAVGNMVLQAGAKPIYVDVDRDTWNIDAGKIKEKITDKTKAILVVHNYGNPCDMDEIIKIAKEKGICLIEDAAEAHFSKYKGKCVGTIGDIGCFSFHATKMIATGEGGAVVTNNLEIDKKMRAIRSHGMSSRGFYWHDEIGNNFRLANVLAAIGVAQLENIDKILENKKRVYNSYKEKLEKIEGIEFQKFQENSEPIIWAVALKINPEKFRMGRNEIIEEMKKKGIETRPGFYPFHAMPIYNSPILPIADEISKKIISLPSFPTLTEEEIVHICDSLKSLIKQDFMMSSALR